MATIFLSYSSEQGDTAARIALSLKEEGHTVFHDRSSLAPGQGFDAAIRAGVEKSDLFVFLITQASILPGRYTLTELKFAEQKWGHPAGHVLPVNIERVPTDAIPPFLRAVTILSPQGNVTAEVAAEVARMMAPSRDEAGESGMIVKQAQLLGDSGNHAEAWKLLERAEADHPKSTEVIDAQERLAMAWLEHARTAELSGAEPGLTFRGIADKVSSVLSRGAVARKGERAADLLAHMGWADFLRSRDGLGGLDPARSYRRAIEVDSKNVFAHAMWGHHILWNSGPLEEAKRHFAAAVESGREREYARSMQFTALTLHHRHEAQEEAIRAANDVRSRGEAMPIGPEAERPLVWDLWSIYRERLIGGEDTPQFLAALSPVDHVATFRWLYPVDLLKGPDVDEFRYYLYLSMLARLQENGGDGAGALASYRALLNEQESKKYDGVQAERLADNARAAAKRLSKRPRDGKVGRRSR